MPLKIEDDGTVVGYMTTAVKDVTVGSMPFLLCKSVVAKTVQNFVSLLEERYLGTTFHRLVPCFVLKGGSESESITKQQFDDEKDSLMTRILCAKTLKSVVGGAPRQQQQQQQRHEMYDPTDQMNHDGMDNEQMGAQRLLKKRK
jgi:cyclophilin family peptidyl-prolyl cis-trans isomerase